jgi:hypothetical protein
MSSPQEKAKELVSAYARIDGYIDSIDLSKCEFEKKCALIAVDEILELTKRPTYNPFNWNEVTGVRYDKYWLEVKQEIEKL